LFRSAQASDVPHARLARVCRDLVVRDDARYDSAMNRTITVKSALIALVLVGVVVAFSMHHWVTVTLGSKPTLITVLERHFVNPDASADQRVLALSVSEPQTDDSIQRVVDQERGGVNNVLVFVYAQGTTPQRDKPLHRWQWTSVGGVNQTY